MADAPVLAPTVDDQIVVAQAAEPQTAAPVEVPAQNENMQAEKVIDNPEEASKEPQAEEPKPTKIAEKSPKTKSTPKPKTSQPTTTPAAAEGRPQRERKQVTEIFTVEAKKEDEFKLMEGKGTKLRDIPNAAFKMSKVSGKDEIMESFHNLLYRRKGSAHTRKKNILEFNGFAFPAEQKEKEMEARISSLGKWKLVTIHKLMDALDVPRGSGDKDAKIKKLMEFLEVPKKLTDVDLAEKDAAKKELAKKKREREAAKKAKATAKKEKEESKKRKASAATKATPSKKKKKDDDNEDDEEDDDDVDEEIVPKKKDRKAAAEPKEKKESDPFTAPEDPAVKLSSDELKADIVSFLSKLNGEELGVMTAKSIMAMLKEHYGFEVKSRKAEIKVLANEYAASREDIQIGEGEVADAEKTEAVADAAPVADQQEQPAAVAEKDD